MREWTGGGNGREEFTTTIDPSAQRGCFLKTLT